MITETLQFDNARAVQALYANDLRLLRMLMDTLGVQITTREGWLKVSGEAEQVARAKSVFDELEKARLGGVEIGKHEFQYALRNAMQGNAKDQVNGNTTKSENGANSESVSPELHTLSSLRILPSNRKMAIVAKTAHQLEYLQTIERFDVTFGVGPAGTGKTFLAMACALESLRKEKVSRIILTRPAVEAGEALGFLPGDLQEKIFPYLRPLYDALHSLLDAEELTRYMEKRMIEVAPLAYMRGRTLDDAFIILDESQNTTAEQMFMFLTRLGQRSKCVVTGDRTQIDLPQKQKSGLVEALQALKDVRGIGFCYLDETDVVRHELVQSIIRAYRMHRYGVEIEPGVHGAVAGGGGPLEVGGKGDRANGGNKRT